MKKHKVQDAKDVLEKTLEIDPYCQEARKMINKLLREDSPEVLSKKRRYKEQNVSFFFNLLISYWGYVALILSASIYPSEA